MIESVDLYIDNDWFINSFGSSIGEPIYNFPKSRFNLLDEKQKELFKPRSRRVVLRTDDPFFPELKTSILAAEKHKRVLSNVSVLRTYSEDELREFNYLRLCIKCVTPQCGIDCGTEYDDGSACAKCGHGRIQLSPLRLNLGKIRKDVDIAKTIALNEWIISQRFADLIEAESISGTVLTPVEHVGRQKVTQFWYHLGFNGSPLRVSAPTHFGEDFIHRQINHKYTCDLHHLNGLNLLTELYCSKREPLQCDVMITGDREGIWSGVVFPSPLLVISQRLFNLMMAKKLKGFDLEGVHLLP